MNIYFVRHAEAEGKKGNMNDSDRELTINGIEQMKKAVLGWKVIKEHFDIIISSPYKRAVQTAQIIKEEFNVGILSTDKRLEPGSRIEDLIQIAFENIEENIVIVGHEPDISLHISALISNSGATVDIKKGAIAKVSFPSKPKIAGGVLEYLIPLSLFNRNKL